MANRRLPAKATLGNHPMLWHRGTDSDAYTEIDPIRVACWRNGRTKLADHVETENAQEDFDTVHQRLAMDARRRRTKFYTDSHFKLPDILTQDRQVLKQQIEENEKAKKKKFKRERKEALKVIAQDKQDKQDAQKQDATRARQERTLGGGNRELIEERRLDRLQQYAQQKREEREALLCTPYNWWRTLQ
eukprot:scpid93404/ scgid27690/ 